MSISADIQQLEPGQLVEFFELDATDIGGQVAYFHPHRQAGSIVWRGVAYSPWPIVAEGFERTSAGRQPVPILKVGNVDGSISSLCLALADLVGAKITRRRTLAKYLDATNFPNGQNPSADPNEEMPPEVWLIERKSHEDNESVEFELSSPLDFDGEQLPRRQIIPNLCIWLYRGPECGYTGGPCADANDAPTDDPAKDRCSHSLRGCKLRCGVNNPLPYGGFPAAGLVRT
ncbi:phage minor tail protein L [Burkholderia sp. BDU5]|uniref:phage minor tail protein L n=1 Tax=Burkholderia sp. BDU5 TaxID=1385590 RepID=UPI00075A5C33|nr:phage minor tail protein L [Burkholderia sp. BDU5]KVE45470.1 phage tail protein [Burkholderia sp. BDU5]